MYIDPNLGLSTRTALARFLKRYEEEQQVPLRMTWQRGRVEPVDPADWTQEQAASTDWDLAYCQERGVTIANYAGVSRNTGYDGYRNIEAIGLYDTLAPNEDHVFDISQPLYQEYSGLSYLIGEYQPRVLYFGANLAQSLGYWEQWDSALERQLNECRELTDDYKDLSNIEKFEKFVTQANERLLTDVRSRVSQTERQAANAQTQLATSLAALSTLKKEADALAGTESRSQEDWLVMWKDLEAHPRIAAIDFIGNKLVIVTDDVDIEHMRTGEKRWLGRFKITHDLRSMMITFENLDNPRGGRPHPHVDSDGNACFGQLASTVAKIFKDGDLLLLFEHELVYLESFNEDDDYGRYAAYWFDVPDARPVRVESIDGSEATEADLFDAVTELAVA